MAKRRKHGRKAKRKLGWCVGSKKFRKKKNAKKYSKHHKGKGVRKCR